MIQPTTRSTFTSTIWNSAAKATRTVNSAKFGGPNKNISVGSKVKFGEGDLEWDVLKIFEDGTLHLSAVTSGKRITRKVPPTSPSWTNLWMVDGKGINVNDRPTTDQRPRGGGPNRTLGVGNVILLGKSSVRWTVESVYRDGTVRLKSFSGDRLVTTEVGPKSPYWKLMHPLNG